jgi:hypothetical protein
MTKTRGKYATTTLSPDDPGIPGTQTRVDRIVTDKRYAEIMNGIRYEDVQADDADGTLPERARRSSGLTCSLENV